MSDFAYTDEQHDAIFSRGEDLLVSAGAGSGKTSVLVQRIIEYVRAGGSLDRILALTFTNAAASDMKNKIDRALTKALAAAPDDLHFARQAALVPQAHISTIHSFCLDLLRREHYRVGLTPGMRVVSEAELAPVEKQVLEELLEAGYAAAGYTAGKDPSGSNLARLADAFGGSRGDSGLIELVMRLRDFGESHPDPENWLQQQVPEVSDSLDKWPFSDYLARLLGQDLLFLAQRMQNLLELPGLPVAYQSTGRQEQGAFARAGRPGLCLTERLTALREVDISGRLPALSRKAEGDRDADGNLINIYDRDNCQRFKEERSDIKKSFNDLKTKYCSRSFEQQQEDLCATTPLLQDLVDLTVDFMRGSEEEKRRRGWVTFADLEQLTWKLLQDEDFTAALRAQYDEVLVDEYQDINEVQEAIVSRLAAPQQLFCVGDVKQSIYRFRAAEPGLFLAKYRAYGQGQGGRRIDLNYNFRSGSQVVAGVNCLFRRLMRKSVMELDYDRAAEMKVGTGFSGRSGERPELHLIDLDDVAGDAPDPLLAEGRLIARRIGELMQTEPDLHYSDFAVLLRSSRNRESVIAAALQEAGLPAIADNGASFADSEEVGLAISILRIIDNPTQDLPLAAVLRSPVGNFSDDELVDIRLLAPQAGLWESLLLAADAASGLRCQGRVQEFIRQLQQWRELASQHGTDELLLTVYRDTSLLGLVGAMADGERRKAALQQLYAEAHRYEQQSGAGLFRFICQLDDARERGSKDSLRLPGPTLDAVSIMSIHKSKGLEFPVVFVAGLNQGFNTQDERPDVIFHSELGLAGRRVLREQHCKYSTLSHLAVSRRQHEQSLAEELRILYVALTRAKSHLILTAAAKSLDTLIEDWAAELSADGQLSDRTLAAARSPLSWLGPALLSEGGTAWRSRTSGRLPLTDDACWQIFIEPLENLCAPVSLLPPSKDTAGSAGDTEDEEWLQKARQVLAWEYPFAERSTYPAKWSVTALARMQQHFAAEEESSLLPCAEADADNNSGRTSAADDSEPSEPFPADKDRQAKDLQAAAKAQKRGTAMHLILERADLQAVAEPDLASLVASLVAEGSLSAEQSALINTKAVACFFASPLGQRLCRSQRVLRELPFTLLLPLDGDDSVLVQGVIDCAFWEENGWVLLDYKTGGRGRSEEDLRAGYGEQLAYYRQAIAALWGSPVRECYLCMLDRGDNIRL